MTGPKQAHVSVSLTPDAPIGSEFGSRLQWKKVRNAHECHMIIANSELTKAKRIIDKWNKIITDTKPDALQAGKIVS